MFQPLTQIFYIIQQHSTKNNLCYARGLDSVGCSGSVGTVASYHVVVRREVEGVLSAQQLVVFVVDVLLRLVGSVIIVVFHLRNHKQRSGDPEDTPPRRVSRQMWRRYMFMAYVGVRRLTGAGPSLLNQPGRSQPCLSWNTQP